YSRSFHLARVFSCSSLLASATAGNSSRWSQGRQASMIAFALNGASWGEAAYIGLFFDAMPRGIVSMSVAGGVGVATADMPSFVFDGSGCAWPPSAGW